MIDRSEGLEDLKPGNSNTQVIEWNVYGKINKITKVKADVMTIIEYVYDANGSRIGQSVNKNGVLPRHGMLKMRMVLRWRFTGSKRLRTYGSQKCVFMVAIVLTSGQSLKNFRKQRNLIKNKLCRKCVLKRVF